MNVVSGQLYTESESTERQDLTKKIYHTSSRRSWQYGRAIGLLSQCCNALESDLPRGVSRVIGALLHINGQHPNPRKGRISKIHLSRHVTIALAKDDSTHPAARPGSEWTAASLESASAEGREHHTVTIGLPIAAHSASHRFRLPA
jgi:hypothetical protein